jgi:cellulose synthase operon protein C
VPDILKGLAAIYGRVGWKVEHAKAVREAAARFPDDLEALHGLLQLDDEEGRVAEADTTAARIRKLDPDAEVEFERAVERRDFQAAIHELTRLGARRKDRKDIAARVADMLTRAGASRESMAKLDAAVAKSPEDGGARLALADAGYARGDLGALRKGLVEAIHSGADTAALREAIELVDGTTELSPYRIDGSKVIAEYQASGVQMPGTAARVLDYSALWIHGDGSGRMLEHEIICIQSREAIQEHAEQRLPRGLVLKLRTVKRDGRVMEPELIEGKPTVTMPHLEVGDYIETESLATLRSDGQGGRSFVGPTWFFREEKIPYWRSEFITISPKNRPLDIEIGGTVPAPQVTSSAELVVRRWRVDKSPALPEEPASAPLQEFIPNVRVGWGVDLKGAIDRLVDQAADETPRDPRLVRVAETIASDDSMASEGAAQRAGEASAEKKGGGDASGEKKGAGAPEATGDKGEEPGAGEGSGEKKTGDRAASATALLAATARPVAKSGPGGKVSADEKARRIYRWVLANVEKGRESDPRRVVIGKTGNRAEAFI